MSRRIGSAAFTNGNNLYLSICYSVVISFYMKLSMITSIKCRC